MKKFFIINVIICSLLLISCGSPVSEQKGTKITDSMGHTFSVPENPKVVACYGSFAHCWLLSGGELSGVSDDTIKERNIDVGDARIIGSVKEPNMELIVSLSPDYVILSSEITSHLALESSLKLMGIAYGYFSVDTFEDYDSLMRQFCNITGRDDLYEKNVTNVKKDIESTLSRIPGKCDKTFLLMRAFSSGIKVKTDTQADSMLREMGLWSIADKSPSLLNNLSIEAIIKENPDFIFVMTMGDEESALSYFKEVTANNPAWSELNAVKNNNLHVLPKELFHYKPNNRWNDSYEYLAKIIYP